MASRHSHRHWRVVRNITNGRMTNSLLLRRSFSNNTSNNKELIKENSVSDDVTNLVSQRIRNEVKDYTRRLKEMNVDLPRLVGVTATDDPAVETFAKNTALACFEDGIIYDIVSVKQDEVEDTVHELNNNDISPKVSGVIVHYPIFKSQPGLDDRLRHLVSPKLDVEGLHHSKNNNNRSTTTTDHYSVLHSPFSMFPCTALSVLKILQSFPDVYFPNRTITIFNRSDIFGRPLANILAQHGAKIYSIDKHDILCYQQSNIAQCSNSTTNKDCVQQSSIIITAVPSNKFRIPSSWIQPNSIVINVSFFDNVDQESIYNVPNINYVPCIGKVTIAVLEHNLIKLHSKYHSNIPFKVSS